jgi:hypothetical protein
MASALGMRLTVTARDESAVPKRAAPATREAKQFVK